jgi:hypothetical protein
MGNDLRINLILYISDVYTLVSFIVLFLLYCLLFVCGVGMVFLIHEEEE